MNYEKIYNQIVERAKNRVLDCYTESHHIIPRCMGGGDEKENLVNLTAREHFISHWLLHLIYPNSIKLKFAFVMMCNIKNVKQYRYTPSSKVFEYARICMLEINKQIGINKIGKKYPKLSEAKRGYKFSNDSKLKMSISQKNLSIEKRNTITMSKQNMMWINNSITETLIYKIDSIPDGFKSGRLYKPNLLLRVKHSELMKDRYSGKNNPSAKTVYQYTLDGEFIQKYDTIKEAESITGIPKIGIICNGKIENKKFIFSFIKQKISV
jgi:hypothetical protein